MLEILLLQKHWNFKDKKIRKKVKVIFVGDHFHGNKNYSNPQCVYTVKFWKEFYNLCQVTTAFETKQNEHRNKAFKFRVSETA